MSGSSLEALQMSGSGREVLPDVQECSGIHPVCPVVVGMPSRMSGSCRKAFLDVLEWSRGPQMSWSGREAPRCLGVVERPSWMSRNGREALPDVLEW